MTKVRRRPLVMGKVMEVAIFFLDHKRSEEGRSTKASDE